jgi:hypothetical protein
MMFTRFQRGQEGSERDVELSIELFLEFIQIADSCLPVGLAQCTFLSHCLWDVLMALFSHFLPVSLSFCQWDLPMAPT